MSVVDFIGEKIIKSWEDVGYENCSYCGEPIGFSLCIETQSGRRINLCEKCQTKIIIERSLTDNVS